MKKEIPISRAHLILMCEDFLAGRIKKKEIELYASELIAKYFFEWNDEIISEIIFQWDNEEMNYPINETNMRLWKHRLETEEDFLQQLNNWDSHIEEQKEICKQYQSSWKPINKRLMVGCSADLLSDPINGLRHPKQGNTTGWYIWAGEYSDADDFFKPICAEHLLQIRPQIIKYLGLDVGFRFLADKNGYADVWIDETLKSVE